MGPRPAAPRKSHHVALLRGINVGGKKSLPMKALAQLFAAAGCADVRTYIQSGNVIFAATEAVAARVPAALSAAIAREFDLRVPLMTRTAAELDAVVRGNPFLRQGTDPATLHVAFLADLPGPEQVAALDPRRSPPDRFLVQGREIYLCCPDGVGKSKLTNQYFDSKLKTVSTGRNWRTVLKLLELVQAGGNA